MNEAAFDADGVCLSIANGPVILAEAVTRKQVPLGLKAADIWLDGDAVKHTEPTALEVPAVMTVGDDPLVLDLPAKVVANVNGERCRGQITITPERPATIYVEILGAQTGSYLVEVRSYVEQREASYPPAPDQLDALWKIVQAIAPLSPEVVASLPADAKAVMDQVAAVKAAFPKPDEEVPE